MATFESLCVVTNEGKARIAQMLADGKSFKVDSFVIGDKGHDPVNPMFALTPDPSRTGCYCTTEGIDIVSGCIFTGSVPDPSFTVTLEKGEATGVISSICLLGTIVYPTTDPEYGEQFLFAIANFPMRVKLPQERYVYDLTIQF
jgi:hypothetical protein